MAWFRASFSQQTQSEKDLNLINFHPTDNLKPDLESHSCFCQFFAVNAVKLKTLLSSSSSHCTLHCFEMANLGLFWLIFVIGGLGQATGNSVIGTNCETPPDMLGFEAVLETCEPEFDDFGDQMCFLASPALKPVWAVARKISIWSELVNTDFGVPGILSNQQII